MMSILVSYRFKKADMKGLWTESRVLFALDGASGKLKWSYTAKDSIRHNAIAIGNGRVYLIDRPVAEMDGIRFPPVERPQPKSEDGAEPVESDTPKAPRPPKHELGRLICLDAETGKALWQADDNVFGTLLSLSARHDVLVMGYQPGAFQLPSEKGKRLAGYRASDGKRLWEASPTYSARPILNDKTVYAFPAALDLLTGRRLQVAMKKSYGCGIPAGAQQLLVFRSATIGYADLASPSRTENYGGIRPGCWVNMIPAGGLVLMADSATGCECSYLNKATMALQPGDRDDGR